MSLFMLGNRLVQASSRFSKIHTFNTADAPTGCREGKVITNTTTANKYEDRKFEIQEVEYISY